jgi:hypothetical protein
MNLELRANQNAGEHDRSANATHPIRNLQIPIQRAILVCLAILPNDFSRTTISSTAFVTNFPMKLHNLCHLRDRQIGQNGADRKYSQTEPINDCAGGHSYCTCPGCAGLVIPGAAVVGAGRAMPAGCEGMTSSGALAYFGSIKAYMPMSPMTQSAVPPTAQT